MLELIFDLVRPVGNIIVRVAMPKGWVDEDSLLSDAIGAISVVVMAIGVAWLLLGLLGNG